MDIQMKKTMVIQSHWTRAITGKRAYQADTPTAKFTILAQMQVLQQSSHHRKFLSQQMAFYALFVAAIFGPRQY